MSLEKTVDNLCLIEQSAVKGSTGVWRLPENWRAWFPARFQNRTDGGSDRTSSFAPTTEGISQNRGSFSSDLANSASCVSVETTPHRDPLADLLIFGGHLWHPLCPDRKCNSGNSTSTSFANHSVHFQISALRVKPVLWRLPVPCDHKLEQDERTPAILSFCAAGFV